MGDDAATTDSAPAVTAKSGGAEAQAAGLPDTHDSTTASAVTINRPAAELYAYWRDLSNLPSFMNDLERVEVLGGGRSHWIARGAGDDRLEWYADTIEERDGELIAWQTAEDADVTSAGRVEFREVGERGTVVTATITYDPPGGTIGKLVAKLLQRDPSIQTRRDLRRFKQLMETGEIATGARSRQQQDEGKN